MVNILNEEKKKQANQTTIYHALYGYYVTIYNVYNLTLYIRQNYDLIRQFLICS